MNVKLMTQTPSGQLRKFRLGTSPILIGRGDHCTLQVPLSDVSREHCRLDLEESKVFLADLTTANGTKVNAETVSQTQLFDGDTFSVGSMDFVITIEEADGSETDTDLIGQRANQQ